MYIQIFTIPAIGGELALKEMNAFLGSHRILEIQQEFSTTGGGANWNFCIRYILGQQEMYKSGGYKKEKVDYMKVLSPDIFKVFSQLRQFRKEMAQKELIPAYAIFTDKELADIASLQELTLTKIKEIKGIGKSKVDRYAKWMLELLANHKEEDNILKNDLTLPEN